LAFVFVLFRGDEDGVVTLFRLCDFVWNWIEDMGSLVMVLFCWMHISIQH